MNDVADAAKDVWKTFFEPRRSNVVITVAAPVYAECLDIGCKLRSMP